MAGPVPGSDITGCGNKLCLILIPIMIAVFVCLLVTLPGGG